MNPQTEEADLKVGSLYFRVGDKVMQNKNNGKVSNGDIGFIRKIDRNENNELKVTIAFSESRIVEYGMEEMEHMELAYATTIHKAMGSEYDIVILPVIRNHMRMLQRKKSYWSAKNGCCSKPFTKPPTSATRCLESESVNMQSPSPNNRN